MSKATVALWKEEIYTSDVEDVVLNFLNTLDLLFPTVSALQDIKLRDVLYFAKKFWPNEQDHNQHAVR